MSESILYLGCTYKNAPLKIRELLRPDRERIGDLLARLGEFAPGRFVLSTCERFEVYTSGCGINKADSSDLLAKFFRFHARDVRENFEFRCDAATSRHLIRVAAGLESRIAGESQILGQVRDAYLHALDLGALNADLAALGRAAIHAGKLVRSQTPLNKSARSIASVTIDWFQGRGVELKESCVVILGTGALARVMLRELAAKRCGKLTIAGRTLERCAELGNEFHADAITLSELPSALSGADVLITCASASEFLVHSPSIASRRQSPLFVADLAVPRNVDPEISNLPLVHLTDLDSLTASKSSHNEGIAAAEELVDAELRRFQCWRRDRAVKHKIAGFSHVHLSPPLRTKLERSMRHAQILSVKAEVAA